MSRRQDIPLKDRAHKGWYGGYFPYRYGTVPGTGDLNLRSRITLAGPKLDKGKPEKAKPIRGERRETIITRLVEGMRDWRATPFENEGPYLHGIRSALCLDGHGWQAANDEAVVMVGSALSLLGAERPTWDQGQRYYAERRDKCLHCGGAIEGLETRAMQFCSEMCAKSALEERNGLRKTYEDKVYAAAHRFMGKSRTKPRKCVWCDRAFHPQKDSTSQKFCSIPCVLAYGRINKNPSVERPATCIFCGIEYRYIPGETVHASSCTQTCRSAHALLKRGGEVKRLKPHTFDHFFTMPINASPRPLTPQAFDWMMMEAGCTITGEVDKMAP